MHAHLPLNEAVERRRDERYGRVPSATCGTTNVIGLGKDGGKSSKFEDADAPLTIERQ